MNHPAASAIIHKLLALPVILVLSITAACSDGGGPSGPPDDPGRFLAGGGRAGDTDDLESGASASGPAVGEFPFPDLGPLFFADANCFPAAFERVIRSKEDWQAWWTTATSCLAQPEPRPGSEDPPTPPPPGGGLVDPGTGSGDEGGAGGGSGGVVTPDSVVVGPGVPVDPYDGEAPEVDFDRYVVVTIGLEAEAQWGRGLWVTEVVSNAGHSTVRYEVSRPGEDCFVLVGPPEDAGGLSASAPTIAVLVPKPVDEPVSFERRDTTWDCNWEPDPDLPLTLYYTDTECVLGSGEELIRDAGRWQSWLDQAAACDRARWGNPDGSGGGGVPGEDRGAAGSPPGGEPESPPIGDPGSQVDPTLPPLDWFGADVDFASHAVLVLRTDPQTRLGGGLWLETFESTGGGTLVDYVVMEPTAECPAVEGVAAVRPSVAIRLPLPLSEPIRYRRRVESIDCRWEPVPLLPAPTEPAPG